MKLILVILGLLAVFGVSNSQDCQIGEFFCEELGFCIPGAWVCDGDNDCKDNSDEEQNCPTTPPTGPTTTPCPEFTCMNSGRCIPAAWLCDGDNDCGDESDELDCDTTTTTECPGFICEITGRCIPSAWFCDGYPDCPNGLDESECQFEVFEDQQLLPLTKKNPKLMVKEKLQQKVKFEKKETRLV